jgi:hypothetical protein
MYVNKSLGFKNVELKALLCTHTHTNLRTGRDEISATLIGHDSVKLENTCPNYTLQVLLILAERNHSVVGTPRSYLKTWTIIHVSNTSTKFGKTVIISETKNFLLRENFLFPRMALTILLYHTSLKLLNEGYKNDRRYKIALERNSRATIIPSA